MSVEGLFRIVGNRIVPNNEVVYLTKEFKTLIRRDRGSPGDADGKKKYMFMKEMRYIYELCDPNSHSNKAGLDEDEAHEYAVDVAELPKDWKPDFEVTLAMRRWRIERQDAIDDVLLTLNRSLRNYVRIAEKTNIIIKNILSNSELTAEDVSNLSTAQKTLMNIALESPKKIEELEVIIASRNKDKEDIVKVRGGDEYEESMNPDTAKS